VKTLLTALVLSLATGLAWSQAAPISGIAVNNYGQPVPFAPVRVCSVTSTGNPCSPTITVYSDYALHNPIGSPAADANGNYTFFAGALSAPNLYQVQVTAVPGSPAYTYVVSGPFLPSSGGTLTGPLTDLAGFIGPLTGNVTGNVTGHSSLDVLKTGDTMTGGLITPSLTATTVSGNVNRWQNPLTYGVGSNQSATTVTATGTSGASTVTVSSAGDFVIGQGVMIHNGGAACGTQKGSSCVTGPTPNVTPQGVTGSTAYSYRLTCLDGLGGMGVAGTAGTTASGNAILAGIISGTSPLTGNYNHLSWTGVSGCPEVAVYRNGVLIGQQWSYPSGTMTFDDIGQPQWYNRDIPGTPPGSPLSDNYDAIITGISGNTFTFDRSLGASISGVTLYHDDTPLWQAAINVSPWVDVPPGNYILRYPVNYTKHSASFTNAGEIRGNANVICATNDICIDTTGSQNVTFNDLNFTVPSYNPPTPSEFSPIGMFIARDSATGDLAQQFILQHLTFEVGNEAAGDIDPWFGGKGQVGIYNHAGEIHVYRDVQFQSARWFVFTQTNVDHVTGVFSSTEDLSSQSMSEVECFSCRGSGNVFAEMENAYTVTFIGGYGLGGFLSLTHPWGFEVDAGQVGRLTIQNFRVEGKNGLISVAPGASIHEPWIMTDLYRCPACSPYANGTTPQIYLNSGGTLIDAAMVQVDDYGGSGAFIAPVVDGVAPCSIVKSTIFIGVWQSQGTCNNGTLTGESNHIIGAGSNDDALQQSYPLNSYGAGLNGWVKLGTWRNGTQAQGNTLKIVLLGGYGFNTIGGGPSQGEADILIRMGNGLQAPNLVGIQMTTIGSTGITPGSTVYDELKVAATGGSTSPTNASWDVYVHQRQNFSGGSYVVYKQGEDQWLPLDLLVSDPGAAAYIIDCTSASGCVAPFALQNNPATFTGLTSSSLVVTTAAAASGTACLQVDTAGNVSNTGLPCPAANASVTVNGTLTFTAIAPNSQQSRTLSATGANVSNNGVFCSPQGDLLVGPLVWNSFVLSPNVVTVQVTNLNAAPQTPAAVTWGCTVNQ
jgi:hypothetical protein